MKANLLPTIEVFDEDQEVTNLRKQLNLKFDGTAHIAKEFGKLYNAVIKERVDIDLKDGLRSIDVNII